MSCMTGNICIRVNVQVWNGNIICISLMFLHTIYGVDVLFVKANFCDVLEGFNFQKTDINHMYSQIVCKVEL